MPELFRFELAPRYPVSFELVSRGGCALTLGAVDADLELELAPFMRGAKGETGDAGPGAGPVQTVLAAAGQVLSGHRVVGFAHDGRLTYVDPTSFEQSLRVVGITTGAAIEDDVVTAQTAGPMTDPSFAWTPDLPIYAGANGVLTQTPPSRPAALFQMIAGIALTATSMSVRFQPPIFLI